MNNLDILLLLLVLIPSIWVGLRKGFIYQLVSLAALVVGVWLSYTFSTSLAELLKNYLSMSSTLLNCIAFVLIFFGVYFILFLLGGLLRKIVRILLLGWVDKLLGILFAIARNAIIVGLLIIMFNAVNSTFPLVDAEYLAQSRVYNTLADFTSSIFPYLKQLFVKA